LYILQPKEQAKSLMQSLIKKADTASRVPTTAPLLGGILLSASANLTRDCELRIEN
jgi:hypothetical protein